MFTTVAFSESIATATTFSKIAAVPDPHIKVLGDSIYISSMNRLVGSMACVNTNATIARLTSPTLRRFSPVYITPLTLALFPGANFALDVNYNRSIPLDIDEQLEVEFLGTALAASQVSVIAWLSDTEIKPVTGQIFTVRGTSAHTLAAGVFSFATIEFDEDLPVGTYQCVGMEVVSATSVMARLVPIGAYNRPGVPCKQLVSDVDPQGVFRNGNFGEFCVFPHNNIPGLEVLCSAATGAQTVVVYLDLIKVA